MCSRRRRGEQRPPVRRAQAPRPELLSAPGADAWVATGSADAPGHLVPLSIGWTGTAIALVTERRSVYAVYELRPVRIRAWREANELAGRTLMRDGAWLHVERPNGPGAG